MPNATEDDFAQAMARCLKELEGVNDPPCHPSDHNWQPCELCEREWPAEVVE